MARIEELIAAMDHSAGESVVVGKFLSNLGSRLESDGKAAAAPFCADGRYINAGVAFDLVPATETTSVDTAAVRKTFPPAEYPEIYKVAARAEYIRASVVE